MSKLHPYDVCGILIPKFDSLLRYRYTDRGIRLRDCTNILLVRYSSLGAPNIESYRMSYWGSRCDFHQLERVVVIVDAP